MTSFKKFISSPIVAKISTVEEFNYVAELFNKNEIPDESGNPFRESDPCLVRVGFRYPIYMCASANKKYIEQYHLPNYFEENKWAFINGFELVDEEPTVVKEIHISCKDGQTVEAEYYEDGKKVDKGVVTCSEPDEDWFGNGALFAIDNMFSNEDEEDDTELEEGDVVVIRNDLEAGKDYGFDSVTDDMEKYRSEKMVIKEVYTDVYDRTKYRLYGDHCQWNWTKEMFE